MLVTSSDSAPRPPPTGVEEAATASNSPAALLSLLAESNLSAAILSLSYPQVSVSSEARPGAAKTRGGEVPPPQRAERGRVRERLHAALTRRSWLLLRHPP